MMPLTRLTLVLALLGLGAGCSSSSSTPAPLTSQEAQNLIQTCNLPAELQGLAGYLDVMQNLFEGTGIPEPEITGVNVLTQVVSWSLDLDGDQVPEINGTLGVSPQLPIDLNNPPPISDLNDVLALLEDHTINIAFTFENLPTQNGGLAMGDGMLRFSVQEGLIRNVSGSGTFSSGDCSFSVSFDQIDQFDPAVDGFPISSVDFALFGGGQYLDGTINLDGTSIAELFANVESGIEVFEIDLINGTVL